MTIPAWWLPLSITLLMLGVTITRYCRYGVRLDPFGWPDYRSRLLVGGFWLVVTTIVSLTAWLIWALLR